MYRKTALAGKSAIITGASRGIGLAIAQAFAAAGARRLALAGRNGSTLLEAKSAVEAVGSGVEIEVQIGDVGDRSFWEDLLKGKEAVDILVNAAGISHASLFATTNHSTIESVMRTNLMGTTWGCQATVKSMLRQRRTRENSGCIINIASLLGVKGGKGSVAYAASKAGILGLTRSLAAEVGQANVRVNTIVPGYVETMMTESMNPDSRVSAVESIPMKRFGRPNEIASAAVFLAANDYANNCIINLDGGLSAT